MVDFLRAVPGEGPPLGALRAEFEVGSSSGDSARGAEGVVWNGASSSSLQTVKFFPELKEAIPPHFFFNSASRNIMRKP